MAEIAANLQSFAENTGSSASIARNPIRTIAWSSTASREIFDNDFSARFITAP